MPLWAHLPLLFSIPFAAINRGEGFTGGYAGASQGKGVDSLDGEG